MSFVEKALANVPEGASVSVSCSDGKLYTGVLVTQSLHHIELLAVAVVGSDGSDLNIDKARVFLNRTQIVAVLHTTASHS